MRNAFPNDGIKRKILFDKKVIAARVQDLGKSISKDYRGKELVVVGILKGSVIFLADLVRELDSGVKPVIDFMAISQYVGTNSSRNPKIDKDLGINVEGKHVLIVEDIVDKGHCLEGVLKIVKARKPASVKTCALLSKPQAREINVPVEYVGFEIPNKWVEGYGMDTDGKFRNIPEVWYRV